MKRIICLLLLAVFSLQAFAQGEVFKKSKVVVFKENKAGETVPSERKALITFEGDAVVIEGKTKAYDKTTRIPYEAITQMLYERSSHSRVAAAVLLSPLAIFAKRKHHWFTIQYTGEDGSNQSILLRLDKTDERRFRQIAPQKTGKTLETIIE